MDCQKVGLFLKNLRTKKNLNQQNIADKMHISRQTVSDIENGKIEPSYDKVRDFAEIYGVTIMDVYAGEILKNEDIDKVNKAVDVMNNSVTNSVRLKYKKIIYIFAISILLSIILFLCYYFFNTYNSVKFYKVSGESDNFLTNNGLLILSKENIHFSLNVNSKNSKKINSISLKYRNENKEELIQKVTDNFFYILDYYNYNAYFDYNSIINGIGSYYIEIEYDNTIEKMELNLLKQYENKRILFKKRKPIVDESSYFNYKKNDIPPKIMDSFECNDNIYKYKKSKSNYTTYITYIPNIAFFTVYEEFENYTKTWDYDIYSDEVVCTKKDNNLNVIENKIYKVNNNRNDKDFIYFQTNYIDIYLK